MEEASPYLHRSLGTLIFGDGVIIRAHPEQDDRTGIEVAPGMNAGAIVRDSQTGRWRYDSEMREWLGIIGDPDFATDAEAGGELENWLPPLSQLNAKVVRLLRRPDGSV